MKYSQKIVTVSLLLVCLSLSLPGCNWFGKDETKNSQSIANVDPSGSYLEKGGIFWTQIRINDIPVGYNNTKISILEQDEKSHKTYEITQDTHIEMELSGIPISTNWELISQEQADGLFSGGAKRETSGKNTTTTLFQFENDEFVKLIQSPDNEFFQKPIFWKKGTLGPNAVWFSLQQKPMRLGEARSLKFFDMKIEDFVQVELTASKIEKQKILGTENPLLRIDGKIRFSDSSLIPSIYWMDAAGNIVKSEIAMPGNKWETILVGGPSEAKGTLGLVKKIDPGKLGIIPVRGKLNAPANTTEVLYRVQMKKLPADAAINILEQLIANTPTQIVKPVNNQTVEVTVKAFRPQLIPPPGTPTSQESFSDDDLSPNSWITSNNVRVQELVGKAVPTDVSPRTIADSLQKYVFENMTRKGAGGVFLSAGEVAKTMSGGVAEYTVLLAALARAKGIPARVAVGLVYSETADGTPFMTFHLWNELFIDKHWVTYDATMANAGNDASRIKFASSDLTTESWDTLLHPILFFDNNLQVEILNENNTSIRN